MSKFFETLSIIAFVFAILALVFLFEGDPDVWDSLRKQVIETSFKEQK